MMVGFGDVSYLNRVTRQTERIELFIYMKGRGRGKRKTPITKQIYLYGEYELPEWIIMEFGRRAGNGASPSSVPKQFHVNYTKRDEKKKYMAGPFKLHSGNGKRTFFMAGYNKARRMVPKGTKPRQHPGFRGVQMFRNGLAISQRSIRFEAEQLITDRLRRLEQNGR
jgi:hypothetical protein